MAPSQLLSDADDAKFIAEYGRPPKDARESLSMRVASDRISVLSVDESIVESARSAVPFSRSAGQSKREYLRALAEHFKTNMFKWLSRPDCSVCGKMCAEGSMEYGEATSEERRIGTARRVEVWKCGDSLCGGTGRFPRYKEALSVLMYSRRGRCGEWAKAFWLLLRATGEFAVRMVYDFTDHVWVEVEVEDRQWIHCDVCEVALDNPLMYERDWGKALTWIFAISVDGTVQDVTERYTSDFQPILARRSEKGVDPADKFWLATNL